MNEARSDEHLLAAARAGDAPALEALLERHQAQVYRFGMKMCRDPEDAKDVRQDTLLSMARRVRDFRGASSLSWLYTIARSFCIKKRRRSKFAPAITGREGRRDLMCRRIDCSKCGRPTFAGCGMHVEQVLGNVPPEQRCRCREEKATETSGAERSSFRSRLRSLFGR